MVREFFETLGISPGRAIIAGWGALSALLISPIERWREGLLTFSAGMACACFLPEVIKDRLWDYPKSFENPLVFLLGLTGMLLVAKAYTTAKSLIRSVRTPELPERFRANKASVDDVESDR